MGYTLTIGKARYVNEIDEWGDYTRFAVDECEGPAPHADEYEATPYHGEPVRCPSYSQWWEAMQGVPSLLALWKRLEAWAKEQKREIIPVTEYARDLEHIEAEAARAEPSCAARALWFIRWSRHALRLYGEAACFETPSEWIDWEIAAEIAV